MLIGIEGELGGGKTILGVKWIRKESIKGRPILTNLNLNGIKYKPLDVLELLKDNKELTNVVLAIDELTVYVDCRMSSSKANLFFSYLVLQSRKRNVDIYYTTQNMDMVDKRVFQHTLLQVLCEKLFNSQNKEIDGYRYYTIFDFRNPRRPRTKSYTWDIRPYYKYYDTDQIIAPIYSFNEKKVKK